MGKYGSNNVVSCACDVCSSQKPPTPTWRFSKINLWQKKE